MVIPLFTGLAFYLDDHLCPVHNRSDKPEWVINGAHKSHEASPSIFPVASSSYLRFEDLRNPFLFYCIPSALSTMCAELRFLQDPLSKQGKR